MHRESKETTMKTLIIAVSFAALLVGACAPQSTNMGFGVTSSERGFHQQFQNVRTGVR
jgi:uncharacterized lipoprotein YajG